MEGETSWASHCFDDLTNDALQLDSFSELDDETDKDVYAVTLDLILPNDLLERILAYLPGRLRVSYEPAGCAYDPILRKWYSIDLPCIEKSNWFVASSCGLVCFMDNDSRSELYVCNPITRSCKWLDEPPGPKFSDYNSLAVSVDRTSGSYNVSVVQSKQVPEDFFQWTCPSICTTRRPL
ncbi:hypothetical protein SASPL_106024 [Salvia splendens]|uniref:Uncharacterized protein n=1 Tax=Salvia splendens TaxID=180675 RepID=A0A8X8YK85_SALSN|nr:hypothetical protein SASPL_106024 [Salvia splendens]